MGEKSRSPFADLLALKESLPSVPVKEVAAASSDHDAPHVDAKVVLRREKKGRGGKTVTRIQGLPAAQLDQLCAQLKKGLGCGGKVEGADVVLLGSLCERGSDWLRSNWLGGSASSARIIIGN